MTTDAATGPLTIPMKELTHARPANPDPVGHPAGTLSRRDDTTAVETPQASTAAVTPGISHAGWWLPASLAAITISGSLAWGYRHAMQLRGLAGGTAYPFALAFTGVFIFLVLQLCIAWLDKPVTTSRRQDRYLGRLRVVVNVPVYNEDPALLDRVLAALHAQTRAADISVVDDGSHNAAELRAVRDRWQARSWPGVFAWKTQPNRGKRTAQVATLDAFPDADILVTIDSDTLLHPRALEEGLKPFTDPRVQSVAGLVLALNKHKNVLVRTIDLVITTWQLTARSALSVAGSVLVNSGPFALYRASVLRECRDAYLGETFCGRQVHFSDDALLTMYALLRGRTVQQTSAVAFTTWPEGLSHHCRQQLRWCRGMFIRSFWRFRYLPLRGVALWFELAAWAQFITTTAIFTDLFIIRPAEGHGISLLTLAVTPLLTYGVTLRTLTICRTDETLRQKLTAYAMSPLTVIWGWVIFRPLRIWGILTCLRLGWGTRQKIEVQA